MHMPPNTYCSLFLISHFRVYSVLRHITWNLQIICGSLAYSTSAILLETFFAGFRVALEINLVSYSLRHASVVLWYDIVSVYLLKRYYHTSWYIPIPVTLRSQRLLHKLKMRQKGVDFGIITTLAKDNESFKYKMGMRVKQTTLHVCNSGFPKPHAWMSQDNFTDNHRFLIQVQFNHANTV